MNHYVIFVFYLFFLSILILNYIIKGTLDDNNVFVQFNICLQIKKCLEHNVVNKKILRMNNIENRKNMT